jgi:O-antigen/teichoic acid export membrane protein
MLLVHSAALPLALLLVRDTLIGHFGAAQAGLWQASVRLSDMYTMVVIGALSMYSLPTLSAARDEQEFRRVLLRLVLGTLGVAVLASASLFLLRDWVVRVVFTREFAPVGQLWSWQLVGDMFMLAGWPLRSALTARRRTLPYVTVEAAIAIGLVGVTSLLVPHQGTMAANQAHALVWSIAFVLLCVLHLPTWQARPWKRD